MPKESRGRYRRMWKRGVFLTGIVSLTPLIIMTLVNYYQYRKAFRDEMIYPISRITSNVKRSLADLIAERLAVLDMVVRDKSFEDLTDPARLGALFRNLKESFGGFVDIGLIDAGGMQRTYVGPYDLQGKDYRDQSWFHEVRLRGKYVSDVFMGYRGFPHFVLAVAREMAGGDFYVLRAAIDMELLNNALMGSSRRPSSDAFLINTGGVLQTASQLFGRPLEKISIPVPAYSTETVVVEHHNQAGDLYVLGYAYIEHTPFILMEIIKAEDQMTNWFRLRNNLILFLGGSVVLILIVILWGASSLVLQIWEADQRRAKALHNIEYTNKMASIGRLAAGVAHEINNPLSIINENAGLLRDIVHVTENFPVKEKFVKHINAITRSVERCSTITHRLLGFAKRMDTRIEVLDLHSLIQEVLGFLEREARNRNVTIQDHLNEELPTIESDKGQLQQVFLNILNNSFAAVADGGRIDITLEKREGDRVAAIIADNGCGIAEEDLPHIFEPFFSRRKEYGTGLGLSITYGIVEKLGGTIHVKSKLNEGTQFTVTLPVAPK